MAGIGGLSIANNLLANSVSLNLNRNQESLQTAVTRLSSGLRINTAADDPSGLAIAESLQAQVNGFDQGSRNVQDATNAAQVAEGALQTTTDILQRVRTLAVEGASDITSTDDRKNLQSEAQQLLLEVNRISQNTNFNGQALLQTILAQRAQLGATIVRLQEDQNNDNVASVNLTASESAIRDLNVGQETTEYTKLQILVQVGTSVLAQANQNAQSVISLFR